MDAAACRRQALDLLARRDHSRLELEQKLAARGYDAVTVESALDDLEAKGLLDAKRFVESFARSRANRGQGPIRIRQELAARGIRDLSEADLEQYGDFDWISLARAARAKKFGARRPRDFKERARQARFLQYRGFDSEHIKRALDVDSDSD